MNIQKLMKQAQQMQAGLAAKQEELALQTVETSVGGGKVKVIATCAGDVLSIKIDPSVIDPEDAGFLEDLVNGIDIGALGQPAPGERAVAIGAVRFQCTGHHFAAFFKAGS